MSVAKSTLSDDVHHSMLPPWGLYFFKFPVPFPHHPHFCECVNHDDAMPRMVTCDAFDSTQKESTTPKGVAFRLTSSTQGSLLSSATLGYRKYNPDGVAVSLPICHNHNHGDEDNIVVELRPLLPIYYHTTTRRWCMTWHLSSRHNMGCDHTIPMGLRHHSPLLSHHNVEGEHTILMGLHHHHHLSSHHSVGCDHITT